MKAFKQLQEKIQSQRATLSNTFLVGFVSQFNDADAGQLVSQGAGDMKGIAQRAIKSYGRDFLIKAPLIVEADTLSQRVVDSAKAFLSELNTPVPSTLNGSDTFNQLNFFDSCQAYLSSPGAGAKKKKGSNSTSTTAAPLESDKFATKIFPGIISNVQKTTKLANLTQDDITSMYSFCGFSAAINRTTDISFCQFFSLTDLKNLEYFNDLVQQSAHGYGQAINTQMTCSYMTSLFNNMASAQRATSINQLNGSNNSSTSTNGASSSAPAPAAASFSQSILKFAHAETIMPVLTALQLFKDSPLLTANAVVVNRKWKNSIVSPFGANLWFELHQCGNFDNNPQTSSNFEYRVRILHNEKQQVPPGCTQSKLLNKSCSLSDFQKLMQPLLNCNFDQVCQSKK